jgi:hypothetical protein
MRDGTRSERNRRSSDSSNAAGSRRAHRRHRDGKTRTRWQGPSCRSIPNPSNSPQCCTLSGLLDSTIAIFFRDSCEQRVKRHASHSSRVDSTVAACLLYDRMTRGRVHPLSPGRLLHSDLLDRALVHKRDDRVAHIRALADELSDRVNPLTVAVSKETRCIKVDLRRHPRNLMAHCDRTVIHGNHTSQRGRQGCLP